MSTATQNYLSRPRRTASARINLRVDSRTKATLVRVARLQQVRLTEFMVKASQAAAESALAARTRFVLPSEKWRKFNAALDAPARQIPALRRLFSAPAVFKP